MQNKQTKSQQKWNTNFIPFKELKAKNFCEYSGELKVQNNTSFIAW